MKIAILSRNRKLYSTRRLIEAAEERDHEVRVLDVLRCYMNIASHKPQVHFKSEALEGFDAVIPRIGASVTFYGTAVLRQFEMMGVLPLNESVAISRSRDKLRSLQLLSRKGIGLPVTAGLDLNDKFGAIGATDWVDGYLARLDEMGAANKEIARDWIKPKQEVAGEAKVI